MTPDQAWELIRSAYEPRESLLFIESRRSWDDDLEELNAKANGRFDAEYLRAFAQLAFDRADELARKLFRICCEIWKAQGRAECRGFFQAVWKYCLNPFFRSRRLAARSFVGQKVSPESPDIQTQLAGGLAEQWIAGLSTEFRLRTEACDSQFLQLDQVGDKNAAFPPFKSARRPGPEPRWKPEDAEFVRQLWREHQSKTRRVNDAGLMEIVRALDTRGCCPPLKYLMGKARDALAEYNTKHGNAKERPIETWEGLLKQRDKVFIRGMRRVFSDCANRSPK